MSKRFKWNVGDVFAIPTIDGRMAAGQVIGREPEVLNSVSIVLFDQQFEDVEEIASSELLLSQVFSVVFATRDLLDSGTWTIVENRLIAVERSQFPFEDLRSTGFVGAKVIGSGIINEFVNAFFGLAHWDDWKDPTYLDKLLISPEKKPKSLRFKEGG